MLWRGSVYLKVRLCSIHGDWTKCRTCTIFKLTENRKTLFFDKLNFFKIIKTLILDLATYSIYNIFTEISGMKSTQPHRHCSCWTASYIHYSVCTTCMWSKVRTPYRWPRRCLTTAWPPSRLYCPCSTRAAAASTTCDISHWASVLISRGGTTTQHTSISCTCSRGSIMTPYFWTRLKGGRATCTGSGPRIIEGKWDICWIFIERYRNFL